MSESADAATFSEVDAVSELKKSYGVIDTANALGLDVEKFIDVVKDADKPYYYRTFRIPKKKGGYRTISAPKSGLGLAQTRLAEILKKHYQPKEYVKGYVEGQSYLTNAQYHEKQSWILNIDIKDFYPSIGFARVRGLFMSKMFEFNYRVATILARITTTPDGLPQGARTSPILANILCYSLDRRLMRLAKRNKLRYSRYADDITFSSSQRELCPELVAKCAPRHGDRVIELSEKLLQEFEDSGFEVNHKKTRIHFSFERQEVTGLVVNEFANVQRRDIMRLRMIIHSYGKHGQKSAQELWLPKAKRTDAIDDYICGWISFISGVRGKDDLTTAKLCKLANEANVRTPQWMKRIPDLVKKYDIFLSHASEDKKKVRKIKDKLEELGVIVFFDESSIEWGDSITEKVNTGLKNSTFFAPFLSETFSKKGWTNKELNSAFAMHAEDKKRLLPIKDTGYDISEDYALLRDLLYREWPKKKKDEEEFISKISDDILRLVEKDKAERFGAK